MRSPFIFIGINRYSGPILQQSLRERLDDGQVWIYSTRAQGHLGILHLSWQTLRRSLDAADAMDALATTQATIHFHVPTVAIAVDGELIASKTPLTIRTRPRALTIMRPAPAAA